MSKVCALVPARSGSKGVVGKNILPLHGHPMFAYSIMAAKLSAKIDRVIVTTDCPKIAKLAVHYGAEVPFMRPVELAADMSPAIDFVTHAVNQLEQIDQDKPDLLVLLLPTTPLRDPNVIDEAIVQLVNTANATGLRSAHEMADPPQKMMGIEDGFLCGLYPSDPRPEYFNLPRQAFPPAYHPNGYVEIVRRTTLQQHGQLYGNKIQGFITPYTIEIDALQDFEYLEYIIGRQGHPLTDELDRQHGKTHVDV